MFCRFTTNSLLRGIILKQCSSSFSRAFSTAGLKADECVLKKGEVYKFTDTGMGKRENWLLGVRYIDLVVGKGDPCKKGDVIHIHHKGRILNNGKPIPDSSYEIGVPLSLRIGVG